MRQGHRIEFFGFAVAWGGGVEIRSTKSEIRNKSKKPNSRKFQTQTATPCVKA